MAEDATLKDVTVEPHPVTAASTQEPAPQETAPQVDTTNQDALTLGQILLDSGWNQSNINDLLNSPQALNAIRYQLENDPADFIRSVERTDPKVGENLLEKASDLYLNRYAPKDAPKGSGKTEVPNELMSQVEALREQVRGFESREQQRANQAAMAQTQNRYNGRVDDLFNTDGVKTLGLTKTEQAAMRAMLNQDLAADPAAVQRVSNGNFVDVPRRFQSILNDWAADKKAAIAAEKTARERSERGASPFVLDGPSPLSVTIPPETFDSWDNTETGFAAALKKLASSGA
jgi:hypothetical protein